VILEEPQPFRRTIRQPKRIRDEPEVDIEALARSRISQEAVTIAVTSGACCFDACICCYPQDDMIPFMTEHRTKFWERPRVEQNEVIEQIGSQRGYIKGGKFKFQIHGLLLCRTAVCRFYGITLKRWERYTDLNNPVRKLRKTREFEAPKRRNLIGWMSYYFSLRGKSGGEWMPHENTLQISYTGKVTLYQDMTCVLII
jgi:hypothetical protein